VGEFLAAVSLDPQRTFRQAAQGVQAEQLALAVRLKPISIADALLLGEGAQGLVLLFVAQFHGRHGLAQQVGLDGRSQQLLISEPAQRISGKREGRLEFGHGRCGGDRVHLSKPRAAGLV